jgi:hypothetical protein
MRILPTVLGVWLLVASVGFADTAGSPMPALGFYITGETGADVLDTIIPELARVGFAEAMPRDMSTGHHPAATFRRSNGDEIRVTAAKRCAIVVFFGANVFSRTEGAAYGRRFADVHATLKSYIARLPHPHPRILEGEIPPLGMCPNMSE